MTVKELAEVAGCNEKTVIRLTKDLFPGLIRNGVKTLYSKDQAFDIMSGLPKKNLVQMSEQPIQNVQGVDYEVIGKMIGMAVSAAMQPVVQQLQNINNQPLQIEQPKQDYYSLVAYCSLNKIKTVSSELRKMGMDLRKMAKESGKELHKIPDERYGEVNSYPLEILEEYFSE